MGDVYKAKIFRSGNSLALRLPKALGLQEGAEMTVREDKGKFTFEPINAPKTIDVSRFWGKVPGLAIPSREEFDDPARAWDHPDWPHNGKAQ